MKREFLQGLKVGQEALPKEVIDAIMAENGRDIQAAKQAGLEWEEKYNRALADHAGQLQKLQLQSALQTAVSKAGGRNVKAISALLDLESIEKSDDIPGALETAVNALKEENGYLFAIPQAPAYARGTGTDTPHSAPVTLADALRDRMTNR